MPKKSHSGTERKRAENALKAIEKLDGVYVWEPDLFMVSLAGASIHDADLIHLDSLPTIQILDLSDTLITDAGLEHLLRQRSLQTLILTSTSISREGRNHLKQAFPALDIQTRRATGINPFTGERM